MTRLRLVTVSVLRKECFFISNLLCAWIAVNTGNELDSLDHPEVPLILRLKTAVTRNETVTACRMPVEAGKNVTAGAAKDATSEVP
jgi:hypothetical protein